MWLLFQRSIAPWWPLFRKKINCRTLPLRQFSTLSSSWSICTVAIFRHSFCPVSSLRLQGSQGCQGVNYRHLWTLPLRQFSILSSSWSICSVFSCRHSFCPVSSLRLQGSPPCAGVRQSPCTWVKCGRARTRNWIGFCRDHLVVPESRKDTVPPSSAAEGVH